MASCKECGKEIDDKYEFCYDCIKKMKEENKTGRDELLEVAKNIENHLKHLNWNLGSLVMLLKGDKKTLKEIEDDIKKDLNNAKPS